MTDDATARLLDRFLAGLGAFTPLARRPHRGHSPLATIAGAERPYVTWAHDRLPRRPVTPVPRRRELHALGRVPHAERPGNLPAYGAGGTRAPCPRRPPGSGRRAGPS
ncbi:hypothetical protein ACFVTC_06070 [Streptomyces sp. NPDC057950]|uniref:hypothetical protein n=1 Tax=Streptomyces sp. NPDC057950 TaxID=3346288 RepID=UPI0036EE04A5